MLDVKLQQLLLILMQQLCLCDVVENLVFVAFGFLAAMAALQSF